ncbi:serine hydrolase domain-containing protein [Poritiphilus flavus]|uniref:Serine hydrolase n=1 Tax=Poritiphilus flavus TaxID=2697053 RepID=A0A6L9EE71_9FLAO|nr:serine hydrolase domain-containing protein [Poritiphilus flavus]NAS13016.1 serine hydrolase [Poritiphilus flavus]
MKNLGLTMLIFCCLLSCQNNTTSQNEQYTQKESSQDNEDAYSTPTEDFSVSALKYGYTAEKAYDMNRAWTLQKFLDITEAGAYSYLHLAEFLPQNVILRDGAVAELEYNLSSEIGKIGLENEKTGKMVTFEGITTSENSPIQGVMVLKDGQIIYESYPGMRKYDKHVWMSNAKVFAGLLIAQFEEEGLIDVQRTVSNYVAETKGTAWENIKVIDVLNMQSGLDLEENPASRKGATPYGIFAASEAGEAVLDGKKLTHNEALFRIPKLREPGMAFEYSSANTQMLCLILEAVGKKRISELITERIWMHAGMTGDALLGLSPQGNGVIHGLISSRLDDMAKFGLLFTPSWNLISSKQIVSQAVLEKMQTMGVKENFMKGTLGPRMAEEFREQPEFNSYQWDAVFEDGDLYKSGMNGQGIYVSPSRDVVVAWFATGFTDIPMEAYSRAIAKSL